jgi:signal transduction histidine kinase
VLFNLLSNALKFTPREGKIDVKITSGKNENARPPLDEYIMISVTDTGKGIKDEHLEKIFDRFYQIEGSESQMQLGTALDYIFPNIW